MAALDFMCTSKFSWTLKLLHRAVFVISDDRVKNLIRFAVSDEYIEMYFIF